MNNLVIRKLNNNDLEYVNIIQSKRNLPKITKEFWDSQNWVIYAGFIDGNIVCISYLFPYHRLPHSDYPNGFIAELGGTYTLPEYRGNGYASSLIKTMMANVNDDLPNLDAIVADATEDGYRLYKCYEFIDSEDYRIWRNKF